jgi:hypothetical protein
VLTRKFFDVDIREGLVFSHNIRDRVGGCVV